MELVLDIIDHFRTSPTKGQHVPVGNILISGVSSSNSTNSCIVSVIINGMRPYHTYQQATSTGINGSMDYSKWNFTVTPEYTTIKEGVNKITAKYSCPPNVNFTKFYSVNVTGVVANAQPILSTPMNHDGRGSAFPISLPVNSSIVSELQQALELSL